MQPGGCVCRHAAVEVRSPPSPRHLEAEASSFLRVPFPGWLSGPREKHSWAKDTHGHLQRTEEARVTASVLEGGQPYPGQFAGQTNCHSSDRPGLCQKVAQRGLGHHRDTA